ncbi:MAG: peptidase domain-containing ABC transporter, partial [Anaerolineae bacterium]|nr:peptidase domain-containing ABC transporter [Anaerolineae bacterium]
MGSLCNLYRIPFEAALVASQFPPPYTFATFHEAARALGFKTGFRPLPSNGWEKLPFPCIAFLKPQSPNETRHTESPPGDHQVIPF